MQIVCPPVTYLDCTNSLAIPIKTRNNSSHVCTITVKYMNEPKQSYHPLTTVAFIPAFFLLMMPGQVVFVHDALYAHQFIKAALTILLSTAAVLTPLIYAQVQTRKQPERWKPRPLTKVIWGFFIANVIFISLTFLNFLFRENPCYSPDKPSEAVPTRRQIGLIEKAIHIYAMENNGQFPNTIEDLVTGTADHPGLIEKGNLIDNWGTPYDYLKIGKKIRISSAGPDRKMGTEDDMTN
jgi:hypothetical protein